MSTITNWDVMGIFVGCDFVLSLVLSIFLRRRLDIKTKDGKYHAKNLPKVSLENDKTLNPVLHGGLFDFGIVGNGFTVLISFLYAMTFSGTVVVGCNWALVGRVDDRVGWLITLYLIYFSLCFMCAFSMNGIHILTSHPIHLVYYGCGYIPLAMYWSLPSGIDQIMVVIAVLCRLILNTAMKYYVWPNYPSPRHIVPQYTYDSNLQKIELYSRPSDTIEKKCSWKFKIFSIHIPLPNYELLGGLTTGPMAIGGIIGAITAAICSAINASFGVAVWASIVASFLGSLLFVVLSWNTPVFPSVSQFYPQFLVVLSFIVGAIFVVSNLKQYSSESSSYQGDLYIVIAVLAHLSHILVGSTYIFSLLAVVRHTGTDGLLDRLFNSGFGSLRTLFEGDGRVAPELADNTDNDPTIESPAAADADAAAEEN